MKDTTYYVFRLLYTRNRATGELETHVSVRYIGRDKNEFDAIWSIHDTTIGIYGLVVRGWINHATGDCAIKDNADKDWERGEDGAKRFNALCDLAGLAPPFVMEIDTAGECLCPNKNCYS